MTPTWQSDCGRVRLFLGDCRDVMPCLPDVDAVVTSPPYWNQRDYGSGAVKWDAIMDPLCSLQSSCQILVNLGLIHVDGECFPYWEQWRERMRQGGWRFFGWYVWDQGSGLPGDWNGRLAPSHEFVFHFNKEAKRPRKTHECRSVGRRHSGTGFRNLDGTMRGTCSHDGQAINQKKIPDSVIRVTREMRRDCEHPARFPREFASELIDAYSAEGETILDPFMGSGTTGMACALLGRQFIGIEREPKYFDLAKRRIQEALGHEVKRDDGLTQRKLFKPEVEA
jgi:DNA modification methylase